MSDPRLATDMFVQAHIRLAMREGVPVTVMRRGDPSSGALVVKVNLLNGTARVLVEARYGEERVWTPALPVDPMPEPDADDYLRQQEEIDPDAWVIEIEDKQGRIWFPGKIVSI